MKALLLAIATAFAFQAQAKAQLLTTTPSSQKLAGVTIAKSAMTMVNKQPVKLTTVAAGIRQDKPFFSEDNIYVGQLMVDNPSVIVKTNSGFLTSSDNVKVGAITMSFVYFWVPESDIYKAFQDAFVANHVDMKNKSISAFLNVVSAAGSAGKNQTVTLLMVREPNGQRVLTYDNGAGYVGHVTGGPGFLHAIYSVWLGQPADYEIAKLKNQWLNWKPAP